MNGHLTIIYYSTTLLSSFCITSKDAISDQHDEFQQLVLAVVQMEVVPEGKVLQGEKFITSPLYYVLDEIVIILFMDLRWLQSLTTRQIFYWGIIASCCEKIPIAKEQFACVQLYGSAISCVGKIYNMYCKWKELPEEDKCLLSGDGFSQEITLIPSDNIRKYEFTVMYMYLLPVYSLE